VVVAELEVRVLEAKTDVVLVTVVNEVVVVAVEIEDGAALLVGSGSQKSSVGIGLLVVALALPLALPLVLEVGRTVVEVANVVVGLPPTTVP